MKILAILAALPALFVPAVPAFAQADAMRCVALANDTERLACYDGIFRDVPPSEDNPVVVVESQQLIPALPAGRDNATMTIACLDGQLTIRFGFAGNILSPAGSNTGISLRRDLQRSEAMTLPPNADGTELLITGNSAVVSFLNSLAGTNNLGAQVTPASSRSLNVRFDVGDLPAQVAPVIAACQ